jgi:hypothetical protein
MPRPSLILPLVTIMGIPELVKMGYDQQQIADYYNTHEYFQRAGIKVSQQRISDYMRKYDIKKSVP